MVRLTSIALAASISATALAGRAGNENYAQTRILREAAKLQKRDGVQSLQATGLTFSIGEGDDAKLYISPSGPSHKSHTLTGAGAVGTVPITVINVDGDVTCDTLGNLVVDFQQNDDVWDESNKGFTLASSVSSCLTDHWQTSSVYSTSNTTQSLSGLSVANVQGSQIPNGPYIASSDAGGNLVLSEVYRVYRDQFQAFTSAAIPTVDNGFTALSTAFPGLSTLSIPVPSRLYSPEVSSDLPMAGYRVVVKDLYDMQGMHTGGGNRAFWLTYAAANATAPSIQRIRDQSDDQFSPFNPRGDGYNDPSTSSAGSGAAAGAYDWVDVTIGSDSGGSVRDPAANQGVYGIRPTHGAITLEGVLPLASVLDTAGYMTRSAQTFRDFGKAWYQGAFQSYNATPSTIFVPNDYFPLPSSANPDSQAIYDTFISGLQSYLNATIDTRSFGDIWNATGTVDQVGGTTIPVYLNETYGTLISYYQATNLGDPWFADYAKVNDGRTPFIDPAPTARWKYGRARGEAGYQDSLSRKELFKNFIADNILTVDAESCTSSLYLYPINTGEPSPRNVYKSPAGPSIGVFNEAYSPFAETPEIVIPLGQVLYNSSITNHQEYLPVSIAIMARGGCDYVLLDLVANLADAGLIPQETKAGVTAF